jgi:aminodeoxyfutalosine deaminase
MFDTDLTREYEAARSMGVMPATVYEAALKGALCDEQTRDRLREIGAAAFSSLS